jgi:hypothetical protein
MTRQISFSKHRAIGRSLRGSLTELAAARMAALDACRRDPFGTSCFDSERGPAIAGYLSARRWVSHYRMLLVNSEPTKMANGHALKIG